MDYTNSGGKLVAVKTGLSGTQKLEFIDASGSGTDDSIRYHWWWLTLGRTGSLSNLTTTISLSDIGGTNSFTLIDTPSSLTGQGNKIVAVNSNGSTLEFIDASNL